MSEGVVLIRRAGEDWGTVCNDGITDHELNLLCIELGFYRYNFLQLQNFSSRAYYCRLIVTRRHF